VQALLVRDESLMSEGRQPAIPSTIARNAFVAADSGNSSTKLSPKSQHFAILGSNGTAPKNGTLNCFASAAAPPVVAAKIFDSPCYQQRPAMGGGYVTIRTNESGHILDYAEDADICLATKVEFFAYVEEGDFLWCGDY
jgi:hypothetical protein